MINQDELWENFQSRRFLHGHRETPKESFSVVFSALLPQPAVPGEVHAQLALIKHIAEYTTEKNWDDKRLYIMQAVDRALSVPLPEIEGGDKGERDRLLPDNEKFRQGYAAGYADAYGDVSGLKAKLEELRGALPRTEGRN